MDRTVVGAINKEAALAQGTAFLGPWLEQRHTDMGWPGVAVAVNHQGKPIFEAAYGHADTETGEPLTPSHVIQAASQTKTFTAATVKVLEQDGVLSLDQPITDFVPELTRHSDTRWPQIRLETLLSNGAGISRDGHDADFWAFTQPFPTRESFVDFLLGTELTMKPDTQMKYSNVGYGILGLVINRATGKPYREVVMDRVVKPLGLVSTHFDRTAVGPMAQGYGRQNGDRKRPVMPHVDVGAYESAAGLYSSVIDLARFYGSLLPEADVASPLSREARADMQRRRWLVKNGHGVGYGLGMDIGTLGIRERAMPGHGGGYPGYMSKSLTDPREGIAVSSIATCIDGDGLFTTIGTMGVLDYFTEHAGPSAHPLEHFNAKLSDIWRDRQIVVTGNRVVAIDPHSWFPFEGAEELEYVNANTLRVTKANGFDSEGELVIFDQNTVRYCGRTMMRHNGSWKDPA